MDNGLIIFSRFDSSRLPGKVLRDVGGRPLLGRCIDRARRLKSARVVVATSDRGVDNPIADFCRTEGVDCFRGETENVAKRALASAQAFGFRRFARICGDSPLFPDELIGHLLDVQRLTGIDVACNVHPRTYPPGASAEVIATEAMERLVASDLSDDEREHCTLYFYNHPEMFGIHNVTAPEPDWRGFKLAVDTPEDLQRMAQFFSTLPDDPANIPWRHLFDRLKTGGQNG